MCLALDEIQLGGIQWPSLSKTHFKSPKSFLDTVSTGSDSDLVNDRSQKSLRNVC